MAESRKSQFLARLENQKNQLEKHGNFAEVVIRTTPEGTDMINFARLWEHVLVQADRQTRGYVAKSSREDFEATRQGFEDSVAFMASKLTECIDRHNLDLTGTNFISRVAQRYNLAEKKRTAKADKPAASKPVKADKPAELEKAAAESPSPKATPKKVKESLEDIDIS